MPATRAKPRRRFSLMLVAGAPLLILASHAHALPGAALLLYCSTFPIPQPNSAFSPLILSAQADTPDKIDAMIRTLLSDSVETPLREAQARALLQDPLETARAHQALIQILASDQASPTARLIICRAIATGPSQLFTLNGQRPLDPGFVDALFSALVSEDQELSSWAARALAKSHDGVPQRLANMAKDPANTLAHRRAALQALERMPGKPTILALADVLKTVRTPPSPTPEIVPDIISALATLLNLPAPQDPEAFAQRFHADYLPRVQQLDSDRFLRWQLEVLNERLWLLQNRLQQEQLRTDKWLAQFIERLTVEFNSLSDLAQRLALLRRHLQDQPEDALRIWALERVRDWSVVADVRTGPLAPEIVSLLVPRIADANPRARQLAAANLESFPDARTQAPLLLAQLQREEVPAVQAALLATLGAAEYPPAAETALLLLDSRTPEVAARAARTLGRLVATPNQTLPPEQLATIAQAIAHAYSLPGQTADVRSDILLAIRRIAAQPACSDLAHQHFDTLLRTALGDSSEKVRSEAVYALARLHGPDALPDLLQPRNLLADSDTVVRLAVIGIIANYPDPDMLEPLRNRLAEETNPDVAKEIRAAFTTILAGEPLDSARSWTLSLRDAARQENPSREIQALYDQLVALLANRIAQADANAQPVPPDLRTLVLLHQANQAQRENQPAQAINYYKTLAGLDLPANECDKYRLAILELALANATNLAVLSQAADTFARLLDSDSAADALDRLEASCDALAGDELHPIPSARVMAVLLVPNQDRLPEGRREAWRQRLRQAKLDLIARQEALLDSNPPEPDGDAIALLAQLDSRLWDYPTDGSPADQKASLANFRKILATSSPTAGATRGQAPAPAQTSATP